MARQTTRRLPLLPVLLGLAILPLASGCSGDSSRDGRGNPDGADVGQEPPADQGVRPDEASDLGVSDGGPGQDSGRPDATSRDGGSDPCTPNPCDDVDGHRTRCLGDGAGGHECLCDVDYHESDGLCCPAFAEAVGGACACTEQYVDPTGEGLECVVRCSELSIEALNGWCPDGQICTQGVCGQDHCLGVDCPQHAECVVRGDEGVCSCADPYHMSEGLCCGPNESNQGGQCQCDEGFVPDPGPGCVPSEDNPCRDQPCGEDDWHRKTCVVVDEAPGYRCDCDAGYALDAESDRCALQQWETCPDPLLCRRGYCVPEDRTQEQCLTDDDCRIFDPTAPTTCNPEAAGGICLGCRQHSDCPGNSQCNDFGTCANLCDDDDDCPYGRCYEGMGICGQVRCVSDEDCFGGTVCIDQDGSGSGQCHRIPCVERDCSEHFPGGDCPEAGETCVYGECLSSCDPNPCDEEPNRSVCELTAAGPVCRCAEGFVESEAGSCAPAAGDCADGFACEAGFCADRADPGFQCAVDGDCGSLTCSAPATLPSGKCVGCQSADDCPRADTCLAGYCLQSCLSPDDCNAAMVCSNGYCGTKSCGGPQDCLAGYTCSAGGSCVRQSCEG